MFTWTSALTCHNYTEFSIVEKEKTDLKITGCIDIDCEEQPFNCQLLAL